jgi:Family of unknown function (DUF6516)
MVKATLVLQMKREFVSGEVVEMLIWQLPEPSLERPHGLKYSLFYGKDGVRIVGYDNERGKGDHRHIFEKEERFVFTTVEAMIADFLEAVNKIGGLK